MCYLNENYCHIFCRGRHGRDRMIVGFMTPYAIGAYNY